MRQLFAALLLLSAASAGASYQLDVATNITWYEKEHAAAVSVRRDGYLGTEGEATVRLHLLGGVQSSTLRFLPGKTVAAAYFSIDDDVYTPGSFNFIELVVNGRVIEAKSVQLIEDEPVPVVSIADTWTTEGGDATFTISVEPAYSSQIILQVATSNGTAGTSDFTPFSQMITIAPRTTKQTFAVHTTSDFESEPDETFTASLQYFVGFSDARFGKREATGNIGDDDRLVESLLGPDRIGIGVSVKYTVALFGSSQSGTIDVSSSDPAVLSVPATLALPAFTSSVGFQAAPHQPGDAIITVRLPASHGGKTMSRRVEVRVVAVPMASKTSITMNPHDNFELTIWASEPLVNEHFMLHVGDATIVAAPPYAYTVNGIVPTITLWGLRPGKTELVIALDADAGGTTLTIPIEVRATNRVHSVR